MTDEEAEAIAAEFTQGTIDNAPEVLTRDHVVFLCKALISLYAISETEAKLWLLELTFRLKDFYQETGGECQCPACVADRKAKAH